MTRIVDGDTFEIEGRERVRYIGIDTPERDEPGAERATQVHAGLVEGQTVRLYRDVRERDDYRRLLAYVVRDGLFVNAELIRRGVARTLYIPPDTACYSYLRQIEQTRH